MLGQNLCNCNEINAMKGFLRQNLGFEFSSQWNKKLFLWFQQSSAADVTYAELSLQPAVGDGQRVRRRSLMMVKSPSFNTAVPVAVTSPTLPPHPSAGAGPTVYATIDHRMPHPRLNHPNPTTIQGSLVCSWLLCTHHQEK